MSALRFSLDSKHFKNEDFENNYVTIIIMIFPFSSFTQTQILNDCWLLRFQVSPALGGRKTFKAFSKLKRNFMCCEFVAEDDKMEVDQDQPKDKVTDEEPMETDNNAIEQQQQQESSNVVNNLITLKENNISGNGLHHVLGS